jgi:hypothetical protein
MLVNTLAISVLILHFVIAVILVRRYLRTRDIGLIWLGIAVVAWPLISRLIDVGERVSIDRAMHHQFVIYPFNLISSGQITAGGVVVSVAVVQQLIAVCLLLIAVIYLNKRYPRTAA